MRTLRSRSAVIAVSVAVVAAGISATAGTTVQAGASLTLCGNTGSGPAITHVVVMYLENESYGAVIGNAAAPYINNTLTARCGVATHAFAATHTSAANYLAATAGQYPPGSPKGCGTVAACVTSSPSLFSQMATAGGGWRNVVEGAPSNCDKTTVNGVTKIGHDPGLFYSTIDCADDVIPVKSLTKPNTGTFWTELDTNSLPAFTWISPDQTHIGENGSPIKSQNSFLSQFVPDFVASAAYQSGTTALVLTYDEGAGDDKSVGENCTNQTADLAGKQESCHVPLWVVYPYNPGGNVTTFLDPYSITKGVEDLFGTSYLAHAADAGTNSLVGHFGVN